MIKTITIGDIHGRNYWKEVDPNKYDKIIFVGDYVDQFPPMTDETILENLQDIIQFKLDYPDKVVLLIGNHDLQYYFLGEFACSGFRPSMASSLEYLFKKHKDLFLISYQIGKYLWSHAGVTKQWLDFNKKNINKVTKKFNPKTLSDTFNMMFQMGEENKLLHQVSRRRGGWYMWGGITWADRSETNNNYLDGYHQIVGHTPTTDIAKFGDEKGSITYVDTLNNYYFYLEDVKVAKEKWSDFKPEPYNKEIFYELEIPDEQN